MNSATFSLFSRVPGLIQAFSDKNSGNLSPVKKKENFNLTLNKNINSFINKLNIPHSKIVFMEQIHGNFIANCDNDCAGHWIPGIDGLVTKEKNLFLCVNTADCVPLFFVDPESKIIAVAHSGWQGTYKKIAKLMVERIIKHGGNQKKLLIGLGPSICSDCYNVSKSRQEIFIKKYGLDKKLYPKRNNQYFLDLKAINVKILLEAGVKPGNIEISPFCTSCQNDLFFSYRNKKKDTYGEMLGVIGFKNEKI